MVVTAAQILANIATEEITPARKPSIVKHGTNSCYVANHCRQPECRAAHVAYQASYRAVRRGRPLPAHIQHGTSNAYDHWMCRCANCTAANRQRAQDYRNRRKEVG